jgi:hypothetical protein
MPVWLSIRHPTWKRACGVHNGFVTNPYPMAAVVKIILDNKRPQLMLSIGGPSVLSSSL